MEPKGNNVLTTKVTTNQSEFKEAPMEEDDPNEPGDKLNDSDLDSTKDSLPDFSDEETEDNTQGISFDILNLKFELQF